MLPHDPNGLVHLPGEKALGDPGAPPASIEKSIAGEHASTVRLRVGQERRIGARVHKEFAGAAHPLRHSFVAAGEIVERKNKSAMVELRVTRYLGSPGVQHQLEALEADPTGKPVITADVGDVDADQAGVDFFREFSLHDPFVYQD